MSRAFLGLKLQHNQGNGLYNVSVNRSVLYIFRLMFRIHNIPLY